MRSSPHAREMLDRRLAAWKQLPDAAPASGWLRALREALGMPRDELARRLSITKQGVGKLEASEADGSIQLETLRRAAEALDCSLVYALVPNGSLEETVDRRARQIALRDVERVRQTMLLEDQGGGAEDEERLVAELAREAKRSPSLWRA